MICFSSLVMQYSLEPRTRKFVEACGFLSFTGNYKKQLLDAGLDSLNCETWWKPKKCWRNKLFH